MTSRSRYWKRISSPYGADRAEPARYLISAIGCVPSLPAPRIQPPSLRQLQRRIRVWTGQSYRDLQLFIRIEEAFIRTIKAHDSGAPDLAAIAADAGFADQSHMGREIRRVIGMSPAHFNECLTNDEAFWYYRLIAGEVGAPTRCSYKADAPRANLAVHTDAAIKLRSAADF